MTSRRRRTRATDRPRGSRCACGRVAATPTGGTPARCETSRRVQPCRTRRRGGESFVNGRDLQRRRPRSEACAGEGWCCVQAAPPVHADNLIAGVCSRTALPGREVPPSGESEARRLRARGDLGRDVVGRRAAAAAGAGQGPPRSDHRPAVEGLVWEYRPGSRWWTCRLDSGNGGPSMPAASSAGPAMARGPRRSARCKCNPMRPGNWTRGLDRFHDHPGSSTPRDPDPHRRTRHRIVVIRRPSRVITRLAVPLAA